MLDAVMLLGAFRIVEAVERADKITRDAADALELDAVLLLSATALRAHIADDAVVAAYRVAVNGMVDRTVTDTAFLHVADDRLEGLKVLGRVAVKLDVGDMTRVGERVIRCLDLDLLERIDWEVHRHMEAVGVVIAIGHAGDGAIAGAIHADETTGKAFCRRGEQCVVALSLLREPIEIRTHMADDLQAELLGPLGLAMMLTDKRDERLCQADETDG